MPRSPTKGALRPLAILSGSLLAATVLLGTSMPAQAQAPEAHWGPYQWDGGQETSTVRAFWLFDRTGDPTLNYIIQYVADQWNGARTHNPELPFIAVARDDANAGKCFVNQTPGYSVASACVIPSLSQFGIKGLAATHGSPHFVGGAFAVSDRLSFPEAVTVVCHNFGHLLGLADSDEDQSCMKHDSAPGVAKWYSQADADAILALYGHDDGESPTALADAYSTVEDVPLTVNAPGVLSNDSDIDGDALTAVKISDPAQGSVAFNANGSFTYTPNANFNGSDSFTYRATGNGTDSNVATVTITVTPVPDVPLAVADSYSTDEDSELTVVAPGVLGNDTDAEGGLAALKVSDPDQGSLTLNADGSFTYAPDANFNGTDTFTYKANDGTVDSNVVTVTITVNAVDDPPVAVDDAYSTTQPVPVAVTAPGVLGNDTDTEAGVLTAVKVSDPNDGSVSLSVDGTLVYTPNATFSGTDSFTYLANDGTTDSNVATVTITVQPTAASPAGR